MENDQIMIFLLRSHQVPRTITRAPLAPRSSNPGDVAPSLRGLCRRRDVLVSENVGVLVESVRLEPTQVLLAQRVSVQVSLLVPHCLDAPSNVDNSPSVSQ